MFSKFNKNYQKITPEGSKRIYTRIIAEKKSWILVKSPIKQQKLFVKRLKELKAASFNIPALKAQDNKKRLLLLEDLGSSSLEDIKTLALKEFFYKKALNNIFLMQKEKSFLKWPRFLSKDFYKELVFTKKHLMDKLLNFSPAPTVKKKLFKEWKEITLSMGKILTLPAHRDFHSRNLMIKNKNIYLIDFQSAGLFPCYYDAVSLLYDPYARLSLNFRQKLMKHFTLNLKKKLNIAFCKDEFELCVVQRLFKACGSFASFYNLKSQKTHLKYIGPALKDVERSLKKLKTFPVFLELVKNLRKRGG